jgi:hypothetical protein
MIPSWIIQPEGTGAGILRHRAPPSKKSLREPVARTTNPKRLGWARSLHNPNHLQLILDIRYQCGIIVVSGRHQVFRALRIMRPRHAVLLTASTVDPRLLRFAQFWCNINPFRINTCKTVSKQTTLTPLRINTYEKQAGWGRGPISSFPRAYHVRHLPHELTPFLSNSCELFCTFLHRANTHLFCYQAIPHSFPKNTGGGGRELFKSQGGFLPAVAALSPLAQFPNRRAVVGGEESFAKKGQTLLGRRLS